MKFVSCRNGVFSISAAATGTPLRSRTARAHESSSLLAESDHRTRTMVRRPKTERGPGPARLRDGGGAVGGRRPSGAERIRSRRAVAAPPTLTPDGRGLSLPPRQTRAGGSTRSTTPRLDRLSRRDADALPFRLFLLFVRRLPRRRSLPLPSPRRSLRE